MTRIVLRATDRNGGRRPFATGAIPMTIEGSGEIIGEIPFVWAGGAGAVWVRTKQNSGIIRLHASHPEVGIKTVEIHMETVPAAKTRGSTLLRWPKWAIFPMD